MINLTLGQILRQFSLILISLGLIIACNSIFAPDKKNSNILKVATDHGCHLRLRALPYNNSDCRHVLVFVMYLSGPRH